MIREKTRKQLERENAELKNLLLEAEETLGAIRRGEVDAIVVGEAGGERLYTLESADITYRLLVEQMNEGACILDGRGMILFANRRLAEMTGVESEMMSGRAFSSLLANQTEEQCISWDTVGSGEESFVCEGLFRTATDRNLPVRLSGRRVMTADGFVTGVVVSDLSGSKEQERRILSSERLAVMGRLTATVAHELRNPLATVRGALFLVNDQIVDPNPLVSRAIGRADRNIERCNRIIDELLDYTREGLLAKETVRLGDWLADLCRCLAMPPTVRLRCSPCPEQPLVFIDSDKMRRCVINLIANSCEAITGHSMFTVDEQCRRTGEVSADAGLADGRAFIRIADNGPGIPPENREKIMEPLFSTKSFGIGLGLPTVRRIIELHGGRLDIADSPGGGVTALLRLPIHEDTGNETGGSNGQ